MNVELFYTEGCSRCASSRQDLKQVLDRLAPGSSWRDIDVLTGIDYAVDLGVLSLPAIAIDGTLVFSSLPTPSQFQTEIENRLHGGAHGH